MFSILMVVTFIISEANARGKAADLSELRLLEARVKEVSMQVMPATVALMSNQSGASGSGVVVTKEGLILTAAHVIQGADEMMVIFPDGEQVKGKVLGANYSKDIAMVQLPNTEEWPMLELGESKPLKTGDWVIALGHSAGFDANRPPPVRFGRVVSKGPGNYLTTDCTLIGGDSGGPLFNMQGQVVGIHSSIGRSLSNNNHAGIDGFQDDWKRLLAGESWGKLSLNPFANPEMPVLGIGMAETRGGRGVIVETVVQGSPAAAAGVRQGDLIQSLDDKRVRQGRELLQLLAKREAGDKVKLGLQRDRQYKEVSVVLMKRSELFKER
ncbi:MAG: S1C family serine protease [Luteolibacter sp.]